MTTENNSTYIHVSGAIIRIDSDWKIETINKKAEEMTGFPAKQLVGRHAKEVFCERNEFADMLSLCEPVHEGKIITNHPIRICDDKGHNPRSVLATILPLPGKDNGIDGAIIYLKDSSEQEYIQHIAMSDVGDGAYTTDKNLVITSFNSSVEKLTGWNRREVIGRPCQKVFHCSNCETNCPIKQSIAENVLLNDQSIFIKNKNNTYHSRQHQYRPTFR